MLVAREMEVFLHPLVSKSAIDAGNKNQPKTNQITHLKKPDTLEENYVHEIIRQILSCFFKWWRHRFFFDESGSPWWWTLPLHGSDLNDQGWVQGGVASCHMKCILWLITRPLVPPAWFNHFVEVFLMKATTLDDCFLTGCLGNRQPPRTARSSMPRHAAEAAGRRRPRSWRDDECAEQERCQFWELAKIESHRKGLFSSRRRTATIPRQ